MEEKQVAKNAPSEEVEKEKTYTSDERAVGDIKEHEVLYSTFGVDKFTSGKEVKEKLETIYDYLHDKADSSDPIDITWELRALQRKLGTPKLGEIPYNQIYEYIKIKEKADQFAQRAKEMEDE